MPVLERTRSQYPTLSLANAVTGLAYALSSGVDPARVALAAVIEGLPALRYDWNRLPALVLAAETAFRARVPDAAAALEPELAPYVELGAVNSNASGYFGSVAQALGWLAAARGRKSEAIAFFQRALRAHEAVGGAAWCERSARAIEEVRRVASPVRLVS